MISLKPGLVIRKIQDRLYQNKPKNGTGSRDPSWNTISDEQKAGLNAELAMLFPDASENDIKLMRDMFAKYSSVPISQMVFAINERYAHYKKLTDGQAVNKAWSGFNTIYEMVVLEVRRSYYENSNNPDFVQDNSEAITKTVKAKLMGESPDFVEKVAQKAVSLWKTIDTERLYEKGYSVKRVSVEEIDGRIVGIGKDYGNVEIFLSMEDCKKKLDHHKLYRFMSEIEVHAEARQKTVPEITEEQVRKMIIENITIANAKVGVTSKPEDLLVDLMVREYMRGELNVGANAQFVESDIYLENMIKSIDYIIAGNIKEAKKCRDIAVKSQMEFVEQKALPDLLVPIAIDLAMQYVPRVGV